MSNASPQRSYGSTLTPRPQAESRVAVLPRAGERRRRGPDRRSDSLLLRYAPSPLLQVLSRFFLLAKAHHPPGLCNPPRFDDPRFSPYFFPSHAGLPPAFIQYNELDPTRDDAVLLEKILKQAGVKAKSV